ncbi:MAG: response regulator transcription factor [Desulfocapsa sp.]|nr:response regulator transcription factor [Desulfocapsa sp.]
MANKTSVVIIDDHPVIRHGIRSVIDKQPDMITVGESDSAPKALPMIQKTQPDVAILDISMSGISGIDLIPYINDRSKDTIIIIYTMSDKPDNILRAFNAGAKGYILKADLIRDLLLAIPKVMKGEVVFSKTFSEGLKEKIINGESDKGLLSLLSPREHEIANLLAQRLTPDNIGEILFISPKTVRVHRTNIMHKLNCSRANELLLLLHDHYLKA